MSTSAAPSKQRAEKPSRTQAYLVRLLHKPQVDNEGPEKPGRGRPATWSYRIALTGANVAPRAPRSSTTARVTLRGHNVCWRFGALTSGSVATAAFGRVRAALAPTGAAIHVGARGRTGPVVVVLGAGFRREGCIVVAPVVTNAIASAPRFYYLSVVTARVHTGTLRGQL